MPSTPAHLRLVPLPSRDAWEKQGASTPSDDELVPGLRAGEANSRDQAYRRYAADVWRLLRRVLGTDQALADVHQEVFVEVFRSAPGFRGASSLRTWIHRIAVNRARKRIRSRQRRWWLRFVAPDELPERPAAPRDDEAAEEGRAVYQLLERLPADERIAFALRYLDDRTIEDVAALTACSSGTVKRRITRAKKRFLAMARSHPALVPLAAERNGT